MVRRVITGLSHINENPTAVRLRYRATAPIGLVLVSLGVRPTHLNLLGLAFGLLAAYAVGTAHPGVAAATLALSGFCDGLDGVVARRLRVESDFGTFFDSVLDRYVDTAVLLGMAWYFSRQAMELYVLLCFAAVVGTVVTSYARARAESLGLSSRYIGLMNRPERIVLLVVGFAFPPALTAVVWILAILSNATAVHRIVFYSAEARLRPPGTRSEAGPGKHP